MPAPWGSGDLLQLALSAHSGVLEAVVPTHVHADHTGFAERARTKADALVWVHQADAAVAKGTQTRKADAASGGDKLGARHPHIAEANHDASNSTCG